MNKVSTLLFFVLIIAAILCERVFVMPRLASFLGAFAFVQLITVFLVYLLLKWLKK